MTVPGSWSDHHEDAARAIVGEHSRLAEMVMLTVDLVGDVQSGVEPQLNMTNFRRATARTLEDSDRALVDALEVLLVELPPDAPRRDSSPRDRADAGSQ